MVKTYSVVFAPSLVEVSTKSAKMKATVNVSD